MSEAIAYYMSDEEFEERLSRAIEAGKTIGKEESKLKRDPDFIKIEKILYSYPDLKVKVSLLQDEIDSLLKGCFEQKRKSKDFVFMSKGSRSEDAEYEERIQSRKSKKERTEADIARIDKALDIIRWTDKDKTIEDQYFGIIEMKYFYGMKEEDIAELDCLKCAPRTIYRNKSRLVNRLKNILI